MEQSNKDCLKKDVTKGIYKQNIQKKDLDCMTGQCQDMDIKSFVAIFVLLHRQQ